jgi:hypothetical protein
MGSPAVCIRDVVCPAMTCCLRGTGLWEDTNKSARKQQTHGMKIEKMGVQLLAAAC